MNVFISWSGEESRQVAEAVRDWLQTILPNVEPWISARDIEKGARWALELGAQLNNTNFGIICVVPNNAKAPWLYFEAGAISKSLDEGRVAPLLVGLEHDDLAGPLSQFQQTLFDVDDIRELARSINRASENPIEDARLDNSFEMSWPGFSNRVFALNIGNEEVDEIVDARTVAEELNESEVKILQYLAQYDGGEMLAQSIAYDIDENLTRTNHWLSGLVRGEYIYDTFVIGQDTTYGIADRGRSYLVEKNLV